MGVTVDDVVLGQVSLPVACGFVVATQADALIALEDGSIQQFGVNLQHIDKQVPRPVNGLTLEIVTE